MIYFFPFHFFFVFYFRAIRLLKMCRYRKILFSSAASDMSFAIYQIKRRVACVYATRLVTMKRYEPCHVKARIRFCSVEDPFVFFLFIYET